MLSLLHEGVSGSEKPGPVLRKMLGFGLGGLRVATVAQHRERGLRNERTGSSTCQVSPYSSPQNNLDVSIHD